jgi:hypothetical protein
MTTTVARSTNGDRRRLAGLERVAHLTAQEVTGR